MESLFLNMSEILIPKLYDNNISFPPLQENSEIVAWGGDLSVSRVLNAYKNGIFPWFNEGDEILWWSPNPRCVLIPNEVKISKSLKKSMKKFRVTFNEDFKSVIQNCRDVRVQNGEETWLSEEIKEVFLKFNEQGYAKSVEVWQTNEDGKNELVGGLYGLVFGKIFCGDSMFSKKTDASKTAFVTMAQYLQKYDFLIDCQAINSHLLSMGAKAIIRDEFLKIFFEKTNLESGFSKWGEL